MQLEEVNMEQYKEITEEFKKEFSESKYHYSDEFLFAEILSLKNEVETLKKKLDDDRR